MENVRQELIEALSGKDLSRVWKLLENGADINAQNELEETVLNEIVDKLQDDPDRYKVVTFLLNHGADPKILDKERCGPLQNAMFVMDTEMLKLLLEHGADPNAESGSTDNETLYDWAEIDYRYQIYDFHLPEDPTEADRVDEESWLSYLERLAAKYHKRPPLHLRLLRSYGARCADELRSDTQHD